MPLYDYRCISCSHVTEVRHGFDEVFSGKCEACGGELKRVFNAAPIVFKGSGFYVTDSRSKKSSEKASTDESPAAGEGASNDESAHTKEPSGEAKSESSTAAKTENAASKPSESPAPKTGKSSATKPSGESAA